MPGAEISKSNSKLAAKRMLWTLIIGYGALVLVVMCFQRRLIYFPTRLSVRAAEQIAAERGFQAWRNAAGELMGWKMPARGTCAGSLLVAHGNAGGALDREYLARPVHEALALDVYVLEYPGYGARDGSPGMKSFLAAAEAGLAALPKAPPVYLLSESIGAGVVAHLAGQQPDRIRGVVMFAPYDDLAAVGQSAMPWLPVKLIMWDRFKPALWLENYRGPLKVVLAGADEVIPTRFGRRLFDGYGGRKSLLVIPHARHNEVAEQTPEWWQEVFAFWSKNDSTAGER